MYEQVRPQSPPQFDRTMTHDADCFVTWEKEDASGRRVAIAAANAAYAQAQKMTIHRATGAATAYKDVGGPNVSVRDGYSRRDYDFFRPGEQIPVRPRDVMCACMQVYDRFPLARNAIDLMADFACKGVRVVHPRGKVEKFGKEWFARVRGPERSERILNMVFRAGTSVLKRLTSRLPDTTLDVLRSVAAQNTVKPPVRLGDGEIPTGYVVLDPRAVDVVGGELVPFVGPQALQYAVRVPLELAQKLKSPQGAERGLVQQLPVAVLNGAASDGRLVPIPPNKAVALHYKKDDFQLWARPLLYPLLDPFQLYAKLMQADRAALDGAVSHIRLWKLGSLEHRIFPTKAAVERLADMLLNNVGGGAMDLIWGPELELVETSTDISAFLGQEKYQPVLHAIYQGLGVPPSLAGLSTDGGGGYTSTFTGLKVLIERLEYGRMLLADFWRGELELVRAQFGFREPFQVVFDHPVLSDEAAMLKLLLDLADRDMVSLELVQERFGAVPDIEAVRMRREAKARKDGRLPPKAGPFHLDSTQQATLERSFVQQGVVAPSQVGLDHGDKPPVVQQHEQALDKQSRKKARKGNGRPVGVVDTAPRKQKRVLPNAKAATFAEAVAWAADAQARVEEHTRSAFLKARGRRNLRQLTAAEAQEFEGFKFALLCRLDVGQRVTPSAVRAALEAGPLSLPQPVAELYRAAAARHLEREGCEPALEKARQIRAAVYALYKGDFEEDSGGDD